MKANLTQDQILRLTASADNHIQYGYDLQHAIDTVCKRYYRYDDYDAICNKVKGILQLRYYI